MTTTTKWERSLSRAKQLPDAGPKDTAPAADAAKHVIEKSVEKSEPNRAAETAGAAPSDVPEEPTTKAASTTKEPTTKEEVSEASPPATEAEPAPEEGSSTEPEPSSD